MSENIASTVPVRLDQLVAQKLAPVSRSSAAKYIELGYVLVNGSVQTKPGYKLKSSDKIQISDIPDRQTQLPQIDIPVIYEDKHCVVINKPAGLLTHSKGAFNPEATVATWLADKVSGMQGDRAGIVHRLDRATSGVMICAKTPEALAWLQKQFSIRKVKKTYTALISGGLQPAHAVIDMPIERNPKLPQTFRVGQRGKSAVTEYQVDRTADNCSLVHLMPTTGRTHQLRVHMSYLGHPIIGDTLYGGDDADRMYLHAESLELTLPNKKRKVFNVDIPTEFLERLGDG